MTDQESDDDWMRGVPGRSAYREPRPRTDTEEVEVGSAGASRRTVQSLDSYDLNDSPQRSPTAAVAGAGHQFQTSRTDRNESDTAERPIGNSSSTESRDADNNSVAADPHHSGQRPHYEIRRNRSEKRRGSDLNNSRLLRRQRINTSSSNSTSGSNTSSRLFRPASSVPRRFVDPEDHTYESPPTMTEDEDTDDSSSRPRDRDSEEDTGPTTPTQ